MGTAFKAQDNELNKTRKQEEIAELWELSRKYNDACGTISGELAEKFKEKEY